MQSAAAPVLKNAIRYNDEGSYLWLWRHAPCSWKGAVELRFADVPLHSLQPAGSLINPAVVAAQLRRMQAGGALAPPVVCATESGAWYIHDGNHRYRALRTLFSGNGDAPVRVAIAVPKSGYCFRHWWFGLYGTYLLEPVAALLSAASPGPFRGRTMVLVAHPDDETACAGLLQQLENPTLVFATNGSPADEYFWGRYGSRSDYAALRRSEAEAAVAKANKVLTLEFLNDDAPSETEFRDQQLYRVLPQAFQAVCHLVWRDRPDVFLVPAYEGGHPDHDSCSFLGALLGQRFGLPVWEMPLYHRSPTGTLICQQFRVPNGSERTLVLSAQEKRTRDSMIAAYASQNVADFVSAAVEKFRPQPEYDYSRPPHAGTLNYEAWQWRISPTEVCRAFQECAHETRDPRRIPSAPMTDAMAAEATTVSAGVL